MTLNYGNRRTRKLYNFVEKLQSLSVIPIMIAWVVIWLIAVLFLFLAVFPFALLGGIMFY